MVLVFAGGLDPPPACRGQPASCRWQLLLAVVAPPFLFFLLFCFIFFSSSLVSLFHKHCHRARVRRWLGAAAGPSQPTSRLPPPAAGRHPLSSSLFSLFPPSLLFFLPWFSSPSLCPVARQLGRPSPDQSAATPGRSTATRTIKADHRRLPFGPDELAARRQVPPDCLWEPQPCGSQISPATLFPPVGHGLLLPRRGTLPAEEGPIGLCHLRPCRRLSPAVAPLLRPRRHHRCCRGAATLCGRANGRLWPPTLAADPPNQQVYRIDKQRKVVTWWGIKLWLGEEGRRGRWLG